MYHVILLLAATLGLLRPAVAQACAAAPPDGLEVDIVGEEALIVWDEAAKRQHFIRRADFDTKASDFGFLVPTPSPPELGEAPNEVFARLSAAVAPKVERRIETTVSVTACVAFPFLVMRGGSDDKASAGGEVRVLDRRRVAGLDAAVLQADSATALVTWLEQHGYALRPSLESWLKPYVERRWTITAFKIADAARGDAGTRCDPKDPLCAEDSPPARRTLGSSAVRMSFDAERPFFPYREPEDQRGGGQARSLRVFLVAPRKMNATIGEDRAWPAELTYARPLEGGGRLLDGVVDLPAGGLWLSAFMDRSSPRPGVDELYFADAGDGREVVPPPIIDVEERSIPIPVDLVLFLGVGTWWLVRRRARRTPP